MCSTRQPKRTESPGPIPTDADGQQARAGCGQIRNEPAAGAGARSACWDEHVDRVGEHARVGAFIGVLAERLTKCSRNRQEQQAEIGALRVKADAMTVAVMELQGAAAADRPL